MNIPDKIYIFQDGDEHWYKPEEWETPPPNRVEYIRKDALLEWLNEYKDNPVITELQQGNIQELIEKIESL
jgi:hypothetical protein